MKIHLKSKSSYHDLTQSKLFFSKYLKCWFRKNQRKLPWRSSKKDPNYAYKILVSEFMLQQTGVKTVVPYFQKFTNKWPDIVSLSKTNENEILRYWQGLGYYSRSRNLLKTAKIINRDYNANIPSSLEELILLPGIGDYASAAIRSIGFNKKATVIDGNVKRVIARFFSLKGTLASNFDDISYLAKMLTPSKGNADYSQAIMEFGALICKPKQPECKLCILREKCLSFKYGLVLSIPEAKKRINKKKLKCDSFLAINNNQFVLIVKRKEQNLLKDMWQLPSSDWISEVSVRKLSSQIPFKSNWIQQKKKINYKFSHINLLNTTYVTKVKTKIKLDHLEYKWINLKKLDSYPLVTLTKKILLDNNLI
ncbi:MAG: A/G-specific adenine glycosylase [Candidatus Pelagibacterales bacterium]